MQRKWLSNLYRSQTREAAQHLVLVCLNLNSEIETADSADFTYFEGVIGDERTNLFAAKLQGVYNCNLLYPCNLPYVICG